MHRACDVLCNSEQNARCTVTRAEFTAAKCYVIAKSDIHYKFRSLYVFAGKHEESAGMNVSFSQINYIYTSHDYP